jgi:hypothetical protein
LAPLALLQESRRLQQAHQLQEQLLEQELLQQELLRAPERNPKRSSLRELRVPLPAPQHQLGLLQFWEQLLFSQQLSWQEPSLQELRHQRKEHQLS